MPAAIITYADKKQAVNPDFPQPNEQWQPGDANMAKQVVNGHASDLDRMNNTINSLSLGVGNVSPGDTPVPSIDTYNANTPGTYTAFGGIVVSSDDMNAGIVQLRRTGALWQKVIVPLNQTTRQGKNGFDKDTMVDADKYIDPTNGDVLTGIGRKKTKPIPTIASTTYTVSGYGTLHHGIGVRFTDGVGAFQSFVVSSSDVTTFSFTTPINNAFVEFTLITGKSGENTVIDNVQVELGSIATAYEPYRRYIIKIGSSYLLPVSVPDPAVPSEPVNKRYMEANTLTSMTTSVVSKNIFDKATIVSKYYVDGASGTITQNDLFKMSAPIEVAPGQYTISGLGSAHYGLGYRTTNDSGTQTGFGFAAQLNATTGIFTVVAGSTKLQVTIITPPASGDNTDINFVQIEAGAVATPYSDYEKAVSKIQGVNLVASKAPLAPFLYNDPVSLGYFQANAVTGATQAVAGKNLFDKTKFIDKTYIDGASGALVSNGSTTAYKSSPIMPITANTAVTVSGCGTVHYGLGIRWLDDVGTVKGYGFIVSQNATSGTLVSPAGTTRFQHTIITAAPGDNTDMNAVQVEIGSIATPVEPVVYGVNTIQGKPLIAPYGVPGGTSKSSNVTKADLDDRMPFTPVKGKIAAVFGDSILAAVPSFFTYTKDIMQLGAVYNYASSGASFTDWAYDTNERQRLSKQVQDAIAAGISPDIGLIPIGTNDFQRVGALLGNYDTAMSKPIASLDRTLILEAARWCFYTLTNAFPNTKWFYGMPIQRADYTVGQMQSLLVPIRMMAESYGFTIINATGESGIIRDFETTGSPGRYLNDGLHPKDNGKRLMGAYYARKIMSNY